MKRSQKSQKRNRPTKTSTYAPESLRKLYIESYLLSLISDAQRALNGRYGNADATLDCIRIKSRLRAEGSSFATRTLPDYMNSFLQLLETGKASFPQFKCKRGTNHPAFLGRLVHLALGADDVTQGIAFDYIYSITCAFKKLKGDYPVKVVRKLFADFCRVDSELNSIDFFSNELRPIIDDARAQWTRFVKDSGLRGRLEATTPQPGPGATNTPTEKNMRYRPHVLYKQLDEVMPYSEWFYATPYDIFTSETAFNGFYNVTVEAPQARFKAVPKTAGKPRGICIEENETQVLQQAVRKAFYDAIAAYFGDNIALREQRINALLALSSSITRKHATIDESEASDRVARLLVSLISYEDQYVHDILMGLSTRFVQPPEEVKDEYDIVQTAKYAPMGSALCFPIMSLIHMFLIRAIIRLSTPLDVSHDISQVYVYGDDIILPAQYTELIYETLPKFGMKLNVNKSFYRSHFRESCGIHAYKGKDVTPVYVKHIPFHNSAEAKTSAFAVEEQLFNKGFTNTAKFQRDFMQEAYGKIPYVPAGLSLAGFQRTSTEVADEFKQQFRRKWNRRYQCFKYTTHSIIKLSDKLVFESDTDAYTRWMWTGAEGSKNPLKTVGDSRGPLIEVTRTVLESAIGSNVVPDEVDYLVSKYPTTARYTHPSWFDRLQRNKVAVGARCYL